MQLDDATRLKHMLDAAEQVQRFVSGRQRADLDTNEMLASALVRSIEVIGEAASRISRATRDELTEIPWGAIIGMRNRLIHAYFDVDLDILWSTSTRNIPELLRMLKARGY